MFTTSNYDLMLIQLDIFSFCKNGNALRQWVSNCRKFSKITIDTIRFIQVLFICIFNIDFIWIRLKTFPCSHLLSISEKRMIL